jgi:rhamnogalacturonan endolyase
MKPQFCRLLIFPAVFCFFILAKNVGAQGEPQVTAYQSGKNIVLGNGIVTATIQTNPIGIVSLRYQGHEMVSQKDRHKFVYFSLNGSEEDYEPLRDGVFSVHRRSPDMVDISCKRVYPQNPKFFPCDVDVHFVLRRGVSGLYVYVTLNHPADYPKLNISVWRMVWSMPADNPWLMGKIYVDDARHWEMPSPEDFEHALATDIKEIVKLTTGAWAGRYDCKYMYSVCYWEVPCWGFAGDESKIGAWIIPGSREFFNDGPTHADLNAETGLAEIQFNEIHYNGSSIDIPQGLAWQKIYGPILLYCNSNPDGADACWADAKHQAQVEEDTWPYSWLGNDLYPPKFERGTVNGKLIITDALKPAVNASNAWVGLAQPEPGGNWQFGDRSYQFWAHADAGGNFSIPNIRAGTYTLYAFNTGAVGEFSQTNVIVKSGGTTALGDVTWRVPHPGASIVWEIGVPDRTAKEFPHGDDYFQPYMWEKFSSEFSNPLDYTVGVSDWSKDWNYVQCGYLTGTNWAPWKWRIHFNLTNVPVAGDATLTIAYASANRAHTEIYVNDEDKMFKMVRPSVDGGNALIREGIHAKYCVERVPIPVSLLKNGANTISLINSLGPPSPLPFTHAMYDYLDLELPAAK